jgi:hypothetical protein
MELGNKKFKSKKETKEFVSQYLKSNDSVDVSDKPWILDLLKKHPRWNEKSVSLKDVVIKKTDRGQNAFHLIKNNGDIEDISYLKCLNGENEKQLLYKAMRHEINGQIEQFRKKIFNTTQTVECELCSKSLKNDPNTHIDHVNPFIDIANSFLDFEPNVQTKSTGYVRIIIDENIRQKWWKYHETYATLRPLCANCNLTR